KAKVLMILDAFNTGDPSILSQLFSRTIYAPGDHFVNPDMNGMPPLRRVQMEIMNDATAFPDRRFAVDQLLAEDDTVVLRWTMTGTHLGPLFGREPTGTQISTFGYEWVRFQNGLIVEHHDDGGTTLIDVLNQLGWLDLLKDPNPGP